jgi:hypothetical protein
MADSSSRSQISPETLTEDELNALIVSAKIKREMSELEGRFPTHLATLVSRIRVCRPKERLVFSETGGANGASFDISKNTVHFSVTRNSDDEEPVTKDLTLTCAHWRIFYYFATGSAGSEIVSVSVKYGDMSTNAYVTEYDDCGTIIAEWSHGRIGRVLKVLLGDLGAGD